MNASRLAVIVIGVMGVLAAQGTSGQTAVTPNFTGTWEPANGKSGTRKNRTLIIVHTGNELIIADSFEFEKTFHQ